MPVTDPAAAWRPALLVLALCTAEVLTMLGVFAFPALLPNFVADWALSNTEAGWIAGIYFAGYAAAAPFLLALTDRLDARLVYLGGTGVASLSAFGFALLAGGVATAILFRALAGAALAATYMPGVRILIDRYRGERPSRAIAVYTACFSLGTALSYFAAGALASAFGWRWAFAAAGAAALAAAGLALMLPPAPPLRHPAAPAVFDFRPVLTNRAACGYILAYGAHCWELFTWRSWLVAFLAAAAAADAGDLGGRLAPTLVATVSGLCAMVASILGNELTLGFGRRRAIVCIALASAAMAAGIGFMVGLNYALVVTVALAYTAAIQLDSAALTAGVVAVAEANRRGATLALHAVVGFGAAGIGPIVFGLILDLAGGAAAPLAWGWAFATVAPVAALAAPALRLARRP